MGTPVLIVGDGQMGLVMAAAALEAGHHRVSVWGPFAESVAELHATRESPRLPGWRIPEGIELTSDLAVFEDAEVLVNAIPTQFVRPVWRRIREADRTGAASVVVSTAKGLEVGSGLRPTEILHELMPTLEPCVLSGPTIATELARRQPAVMIAACRSADLVHDVHRTFGTPWLRIYEGADLLGVELAGALKNVIAIAAGICDGLELGFNAKSALLARGLAEMSRFGVAMGAEARTFFGVAGVGDLATTCFSPDGRNRSCGEAIARGAVLVDYLEEQTCVVEGVPTVESVLARAEAAGLDLPITVEIGRILFEGLDPRIAIQDLMSRPSGAEGL